MRSGSRLVWLGLTPEPERELPVAVATLRAHRTRRADAPTGRDLAPWIGAEIRRIDALIMHGTQRTWLRYLSEVTALIEATVAADRVTGCTAADLAVTLHAAETVLEHHRMLIGLPGRAYERVSGDREALARVVAQLRESAVRP